MSSVSSVQCTCSEIKGALGAATPRLVAQAAERQPADVPRVTKTKCACSESIDAIFHTPVKEAVGV